MSSPFPPQVMLLLWGAGKAGWQWGVPFACLAGFLLVFQFVAVYLRVLPYLSNTFGNDSAIYRVFLLLGFPFGMVMLDFLMFLEPFGLLAIVPMPDRLRQFIPACECSHGIPARAPRPIAPCLATSIQKQR